MPAAEAALVAVLEGDLPDQVHASGHHKEIAVLGDNDPPGREEMRFGGGAAQGGATGPVGLRNSRHNRHHPIPGNPQNAPEVALRHEEGPIGSDCNPLWIR